MALFGLVGAALGIGKAVGGLIRKIGKGAGKVASAATRVQQTAASLPGVGPVAGAATGLATLPTRMAFGRIASLTAGGAVTTSTTRSVSASMSGGGQRRKYRRMNVTNMKALDRSIRRVQGFEKRVRAVVSITRPRSQGGTTVRFKTKKRSR